MNPKHRKILSVLELARYTVGNLVWRVTLQYEPLPDLSEDDFWMENCHPKVLFEGPYKSHWPKNIKLPRLHCNDFDSIIAILMADLDIEPFEICEVIRSSDTGEFFYCNQDDEWMPESSLFDTDIAARRERTRIMNMMKRWASR